MIVEYFLGVLGVVLALLLVAYLVKSILTMQEQVRAFKRIAPACQRYIDEIPGRYTFEGICWEMMQLQLAPLTKREIKLLRPSRKNLRQFFDERAKAEAHWWPTGAHDETRQYLRLAYCKWVVKNYGDES